MEIEKSNQKQFYKILCSHSKNKDPKLSILEWDFRYSFLEENNCICGNAIKENCIIENNQTGYILIVGNICINKFLNKDVSFIFKGLNAIKKLESPNKSFINYCKDKGYISDFEYSFLINMFRKKKFTIKQKEFKNSILLKLRGRNKW